MNFKQQLANQLRPELRAKRGLSALNKVIAFLIIAAVAFTIIETELRFSGVSGVWFAYFEAFVFVVFLIEYIARVYVADAPDTQGNTQSRLSYAKTPWSLLDLFVLFTFVLEAFGPGFVVLRLVRVLRILRLARLGRFTNSLDLIIESISARKYEILLTFLFALFLMVMCASVLYVFEAEQQPQAFGSIPRALWWSIATLTTVGYGDVTPITTMGKISAGLTAIIGIGLVALPAGILASAFSDALQKRREIVENGNSKKNP